ncbi:hypothetical protein [Sinomicrobium pectinilyticum]|uniref:Ig-like domain-containing protein n=1 Tax=Sinomicrobium pectinilyticum TaxID=1084421 RepID=A0A3N0DQN2_SINP1|nr:hypothetical protein [Sinomicrobium pectinilyticum]RNL77944.1 hypothetical protein ED312_20350 [Sinomicrobium pectinilyticum]
MRDHLIKHIVLLLLGLTVSANIARGQCRQVLPGDLGCGTIMDFDGFDEYYKGLQLWPPSSGCTTRIGAKVGNPSHMADCESNTYGYINPGLLGASVGFDGGCNMNLKAFRNDGQKFPAGKTVHLDVGSEWANVNASFSGFYIQLFDGDRLVLDQPITRALLLDLGLFGDRRIMAVLPTAEWDRIEIGYYETIGIGFTLANELKIYNILSEYYPAAGYMDATFTSQPRNLEVTEGESGNFSAALDFPGEAPDDLQYRWQVNTGDQWTDLEDGGYYSGTKTTSLELSGVSPELNGYRYRLIAESGNKAGCFYKESDAAGLKVNEIAVIPGKCDVVLPGDLGCGTIMDFDGFDDYYKGIVLWPPWEASTGCTTRLGSKVGNPSHMADCESDTYGYINPGLLGASVGLSGGGCKMDLKAFRRGEQKFPAGKTVYLDVGSQWANVNVSFSGFYIQLFDGDRVVLDQPITRALLLDLGFYGDRRIMAVTPAAEWNRIEIGYYETIGLGFTLANEIKIYNILSDYYPAVENVAFDPQPQDLEVTEGDSGNFSAELIFPAGVMSDLRYRWQVNTGDEWTDLENGSYYSGVKTTSLELSGISSELNGYRYRLIARSKGGECLDIASDPAVLRIGAGIRNCIISNAMIRPELD